MSSRISIALDAMGGDHAPEIVVAGAEIARERFPNGYFLFFGDREKILPILSSFPKLSACSEIRHTTSFIAPDDKPGQALRNGKDSSMHQAISAVKAGSAAAIVSAGNTGALMALAKFALRMLPGIDRPAIVSYFPTTRAESVMLDLGANVSCNAINLVQFAHMGDIFARTVLGLQNPSIGLLNVGSEGIKGHEELKEASIALKQGKLGDQFIGFVEGNDITKGSVDVVVTDGFSGNIALKAIEGAVKLYGEFLRQSIKSSFLAQIGALLCRPAFRALRYRADPRRYNGAILMGLDGICVKSHGGTDAFGFANAISVAFDMVTNGAIEKMKHNFSEIGHSSTFAKTGKN